MSGERVGFRFKHADAVVKRNPQGRSRRGWVMEPVEQTTRRYSKASIDLSIERSIECLIAVSSTFDQRPPAPTNPEGGLLQSQTSLFQSPPRT